MFWRKIEDIFKELPNIFGIAEVILIVAYSNNQADHERTLHMVLLIFRKENLNLNKDNRHYRCTTVPSWGDYFQARHKTGSQKSRSIHQSTSSEIKKEFQAFLGIMNNLSTFSPATVEVGEPLQRYW